MMDLRGQPEFDTTLLRDKMHNHTSKAARHKAQARELAKSADLVSATKTKTEVLRALGRVRKAPTQWGRGLDNSARPHHNST